MYETPRIGLLDFISKSINMKNGTISTQNMSGMSDCQVEGNNGPELFDWVPEYTQVTICMKFPAASTKACSQKSPDYIQKVETESEHTAGSKK